MKNRLSILAAALIFMGTAYANEWNTNTHDVYVGDYNNDGYEDILLKAKTQISTYSIPYNLTVDIESPIGNKDTILIANGDGTFQVVYSPSPSDIESVEWTASPHALESNDYNSDGITDLAVIPAYANSRNVVLLGTGDKQDPVIEQQAIPLTQDTPPVIAARGNPAGSVGNNYSIDDGTFVRSLPGGFSVSSTGKANYSIPIEQVPSPANIAPQLSLQYTGVTSDSEVGIGWILGGLSKITRCKTTLDQDGYINGVNYNNSDKFCINGQRLVAINGNYGASGTEYRTENETFTKIVSYGSTLEGPNYFKVWHKSGQIEEYGNTSNSKKLRSDSQKVVEWNINKVQDRESNTATYSYIALTSAGVHKIDKIQYSTGRVQFDYKPRNDVTPGYTDGALSKNDERIEKIKIYSGSTQVRYYELGYQYGTQTGSSQLNSVKECVPGIGCTPATTFDWESSKAQISYTKTPTETGATFTQTRDWQQYQTCDVNGDGKNDLIMTYRENNTLGRVLYQAKSSGNGFIKVSTETETKYEASFIEDPKHQRVLTGDVNGDGKCDLVWVARFRSDFYRVIYLANPDGKGWTSSGYQVDNYNDYQTFTNDNYLLTDVDGDGRSDLVWAFSHADKVGKAVYLSRTTSGGKTYLGKASYIEDDDFSSSVFKNQKFSPADINGDGKSDLIWTFTNKNKFYQVVYLANDNGSGFRRISVQTDNTIFPSTNLVKDLQVSYGDVNADHKSDMVITYNYNGDLGWAVYLATELGTSFKKVDSKVESNIDPTYFEAPSSQLVDLNADGKADLLYTYTEGSSFKILAYTAQMDGRGFSNKIQSTLGSAKTTDKNQTYMVADINGDGKADLIRAYNTSSYQLKRNAYVLPKTYPDHIVKITNGFDSETHIEYEYLADNSFYTKGTGSAYPYRDDNGLGFAVKHVQVDNGIGGFNEYDYQYKGARTHLRGRGFTGFETKKTIDLQTGFTTTETFRQDYPFIGSPNSVVVTQSNGKAIDKQFKHWKSHTINHSNGEKTTLVYQKDSVSLNYDLSGSSISATATVDTYDHTYGNLENSVTVTGNGFSGGIDGSYDPDGTYTTSQITSPVKKLTRAINYSNSTGTNWRLGFITRTDETHYLYDGSANRTVTNKYTPYNSSTFNTKTETKYAGTDKELNITYVRDSYGNITHTTVSGSGISSRTGKDLDHLNGIYPRRKQNALGHEDRFEYDVAVGAVTKKTDENGLINDYRYDSFGRLAYSMSPAGVTTTSDIEWCKGCVANSTYSITTTASKGGVKASPDKVAYYDRFDRLLYTKTEAFDGRDIVSEIKYDELGRKERVSQPHYSSATAYWNTFEYDDLGRVTKEIHADGGIISNTYSGDSTYATKIVSTNTVKLDGVVKKTITNTKKLNALKQLMQSTDGNNVSVDYKYDPQGNLRWTQVNNNSATTTVLETDIAGNRTYLSDPDAGEHTYSYDCMGNQRQHIQHNNGNQHTTTNHYDALDRIETRVEDDGDNVVTSEWFYDNAANGIGLLGEMTGPNFYKSYFYDGLSRIEQTETQVMGESDPKIFKYRYDSVGRELTVRYPSQLKIENVYNSHGYRYQIKDAETDTVYWEGNEQDAYGNTTNETYGNGLVTNRNYNLKSGALNYIQTGTAAQSTSVQNLSYKFDTAMNLYQRKSQRPGESITESFDYDNLHRLKKATTTGLASGSRTHSYDYDALGNITYKSGVSDVNGYRYGANGGGVHAVSSVTLAGTTTQYHYDGKGNMVANGDRTLTYSVFNKPTQINATGVQTTFVYGPDHKRIYQHTINNGRDTKTKYYENGAYEVVQEGNKIRQKTYVGDFLVHTAVVQGGSLGVGDDFAYLHKDNIGSTESITDRTGALKERMLFDPHGSRRSDNWENSDAELDARIADVTFENTTRGFTGHEHIDAVGIIHMHGRVYDPVIGRFLSTDNFVQAPEFSQSFNRYSYVVNNPLSYTDPTGEYFDLVVEAGSISTGVYSVYDDLSNGDYGWAAVSAGGVVVDVVGAAVPFVPGVSGAAIKAGRASGKLPKLVDKGVDLVKKVDGAVRKTVGKIGGAVKNQAKRLGDSIASKWNKFWGKKPKTGQDKKLRKCCFVAGTQILADEGYVNIEDIKIGDLLLAKNVETGEQDYKPVTQLFKKYRLIYELIVISADGETKLIETTDDHPFYVSNKGFVDTIDLVVGDVIETKENGSVIVQSVVNSGRYDTTYNFEVADFHTYYATQFNLLVHNCDLDKPPKKRDDTLEPGPFADESIPARGPKRDFTKAEREQINRIGSETGCHTCGTKKPGTKSENFIPDHQPANALNTSGGSQKLYPHCKTCSGRQAGQVTQAKRRLSN